MFGKEKYKQMKGQCGRNRSAARATTPLGLRHGGGYDYALDNNITFNYDNQLIQEIAKGVSTELKVNSLGDDNKPPEFELANVSEIRVVK